MTTQRSTPFASSETQFHDVDRRVLSNDLNSRDDDSSSSLSPISTSSQSSHESEAEDDSTITDLGFTFSEIDLIPSEDAWSDSTSQAYSYPEPESIYGEDEWYDSATAQLGSISVQRQSRKPGEVKTAEPESPYGVRRLAVDESQHRSSAFNISKTGSLFRPFNSNSRKTKPAFVDTKRAESTIDDFKDTQTEEKESRTNSLRRRSMFSRSKEPNYEATPKPPPLPPPQPSSELEGFPASASGTSVKKSRNSMFGFVTFWEDKSNSTDVSGSQTGSQSLSRSSSFHSLRSPAKLVQSISKVPPLPKRGFSDLQRKDIPLPRKKDELSNVFRSLENDYQRLNSKPVALKMSIIRSSLMTFLSQYATHRSDLTITPEQAERRAKILNDWWNQLLSMLKDPKIRVLPASDRPVLYEAINSIMDRAEWRHPNSSFAPLSARAVSASLSRSSSESSDESHNSEFVEVSALHNIRNMFVKNLIDQMSFVVQKMVLRTPSTYLVEFCAKSCAFAFFFAPGISERLVRLWKPSLNNIKRVVEACGFKNIKDVTKAQANIVPHFPKCMEPLVFASYREMLETFRSIPLQSLEIEAIKWHENWTKRWTGKDGELFYAFVKHFHLLLADFLPKNATDSEIIAAPGFIYVHAQLLANIDALIHRQSRKSMNGPNGESVATSFDEFLALDLSGPSRMSMDIGVDRDLRVNTLLKDLLLPQIALTKLSSQIFANTVSALIRSATTRTSLFNHEACFTLCDFLEDAMRTLIQFEETSDQPQSFLEWPFWLDVFRKMVASENTITEVRVYGFLFNSWDIITSSWNRRRSLCEDFLLHEDYFNQNFNHWCPLVRAFYMRLLCWRVSRCDDNAKDEEIEILEMLHSRLNHVWAQYRYLVEEAEAEKKILPSTTPCTPAPSRRLLIIRTDCNIGAQTGANGLNSLASSSLQVKFDPEFTPIETTETSSFGAAQILEKVASAIDRTRDTSRRRSGLLRTMMGYRLWENPEASPEEAIADESITQFSSTDAFAKGSSRSSLYEPRPQISKLQTSSISNADSSRSTDIATSNSNETTMTVLATFKFSMEASDKKPPEYSHHGDLPPPRLPLSAQLLLRSRSKLTSVGSIIPVKPLPRNANAMRYAGRALAEWSLVVNECQNFFERRKNEGVISNALVEIPLVDMEPFKKPL